MSIQVIKHREQITNILHCCQAWKSHYALDDMVCSLSSFPVCSVCSSFPVCSQYVPTLSQYVLGSYIFRQTLAEFIELNQLHNKGISMEYFQLDVRNIEVIDIYVSKSYSFNRQMRVNLFVQLN